MAPTRSAVTFSVAALSLIMVGSMVGCATPETAMERELDMLKREMASLHAGQSKQRPATPQTPYYDPYDPYGNRSPGQGAYGSNTPAGPPPVPRAPTTAPPPLPVVKLDPLQTNPFSDGREPPIRLGRQGHSAPPVTAGGPMQYDRIDTQGNLVGPAGQVMYRAGHTSEPIDTHPDEEMAYRIYEDPHESPATKVARGTRVPHIPRPGESTAYDQGARAPGIYGLDDGGPVAMPGHTPGVQPVVQPRVQQFPIESHELAFDRGPGVRVEQGLSYGQVQPQIQADYGSPQYAPPAPAFAAPAAQPMETYGASPTELPPEFLGGSPFPETFMEPALPEPMAIPTPAPLPVVADKTFPEAVHAPGKSRMIKQKVYKGRRNKLVKTLYKTATSKMRAGDRKAAVRLFKKLLTRYSNHDLADNALYWLGETAYNQKNWRQALTWFQDVVVRYPEGNKLPDAMLKSALCYAQLGQRDYAVRMLSEVESLFQSAPVAQIARKRRLALAGGNGG